MTPEKMKQYEEWRQELVEVAIQEFGYGLGVIQPLADGHVYQDYFEDGDTPRQALQSAELNGL